MPAALLQPKDSFPSFLGFSDCPLPCTLYNICSKVCSFGLVFTRDWAQWFLGPTVYFPFSLSNLRVSQQICASAEHKQWLLLLYPTVLCLLPGENLLLECQLLGLGVGWLSVKGLGSGGCMKQLPFPVHCLAHPRAGICSASRASAQLSQLCASGWTLRCWLLFQELSPCPTARGTDALMAQPVSELYLCFPVACCPAEPALPASISVALALRWLLPSCFPQCCAAHPAMSGAQTPLWACQTLCRQPLSVCDPGYHKGLGQPIFSNRL